MTSYSAPTLITILHGRAIYEIPPGRQRRVFEAIADNASIRLRTALNYCHLGEPSVLSAGRMGCGTSWRRALIPRWTRYGDRRPS